MNLAAAGDILASPAVIRNCAFAVEVSLVAITDVHSLLYFLTSGLFFSILYLQKQDGSTL